MKIKAQGHTFDFAISSLRRVCWVFRLEQFNGVPCKDYGSDPFSTERECRAGAKHLAETGMLDPVYGWVARPNL